MEGASTPQLRSARKTKRTSPLENILQTTKRLLTTATGTRTEDVHIDTDEADNSHSAESLLTHVSPTQPPSKGKTFVCEGDSFQSAIEAALAAAIGNSLKSLSEAVRDLKEGQARLEDRLNAIDQVSERVTVVESAMRTMSKKQSAYDQDFQAIDGHLRALSKRVEDVEKSAQFLSDVVEEAAAERQKLSRDIQVVRDTVPRPRSQAETAASTSDATSTRSVAEHARGAVHDQGVTLAVVQNLMTEERMKAEVRNNVLLSPLQETNDENLRDILLGLVPDLEHHEFDATRIGRRVGEGKPRLVLVRTTPPGKRILMSKRGLKYRDQQIYFNHDLTRAERAERKRLLPMFRHLRAANIACSFPRDKIYRDGKEMSMSEIESALPA